jgi:hypothetical protein
MGSPFSISGVDSKMVQIYLEYAREIITRELSSSVLRKRVAFMSKEDSYSLFCPLVVVVI